MVSFQYHPKNSFALRLGVNDLTTNSVLSPAMEMPSKKLRYKILLHRQLNQDFCLIKNSVSLSLHLLLPSSHPETLQKYPLVSNL